jgi:hypothetical protein
VDHNGRARCVSTCWLEKPVFQWSFQCSFPRGEDSNDTIPLFQHFWVSGLGLMAELISGFAAEAAGCSFLGGLFNVPAICLSQEGKEHHTKMHSVEIDEFDFCGFEFGVGNDHIHEMDIVFSLWFGHSSIVKFDGGIDGAKEVSYGCNQFGFRVEVGESGDGVFQDWFGHSDHKLPHVHDCLKQLVDVTGGSSVFDEELELLQAL